ncbi:MAG TPA: GNVR domain-containing protein, partial [Vicinamibacteria bacterium]|nr:GNVR domain-containing protein [Vicinamibacteria bacterium]
MLLVRPEYRATTQILIERENPNVLAFKEVAQVDAARDDYYQTQYTLLRSRLLARRVIDELKLYRQPELGGPLDAQQLAALEAAGAGASPLMEKAIDRFLRRLSVQPVRNSRLVSVSFEAYRPQLATQVANRLAQLYIQQTLEFRYETSSEAGEWLGDQIGSQRKKVTEAEASLQKLKEREGIVNIEERRALLEQKLKELGTALTNLKTTRLQREALFVQMRGAGNAEELPEVLRSPVVQSLRIELANLERRQAQLLEQYLDEHPEVMQVRNQIKDTRGKIAAESRRVIRAAENDYKAAAAQESSVAGALEAAKAEALELSRRGVQYDSVKHELDAAKQVLDSMLSRHKEMDVSSELKASNIRIVDPAAVPQEPVRPRRVRDLLIGLLVGLAGAMAVAFTLEYLDSSIKTVEDVRAQLGVPLLGVIPRTAEDAGVVMSTRTGQPFQEGYRALRTALTYSWPEGDCRIVLVTST